MKPERHARVFSPLVVGRLTVPNRIVHAATLTNYAEANLPTARHVEYYAARAAGGAGLIVTEAIAVHAKSVPTPTVIAGWDARSRDGLGRIADATHAHGVPILAQLWHVGRQQLWTPISAPWAPSPLPDPLSGTIPHEMTHDEIDEVVEHFAMAARTAELAGLDGVELHGAHGYLIGQFLSPWSNRRADDYGGPLDNRLRFLLRIVQAIRAACAPGFVLGLKTPGHEFVDGGIDLPEAERIAAALATTRAVDYLAVSQGNFSKSLEAHAPDMHFPRAAFRELSRAVRTAADGIPVCALARIHTIDEADDLIAAGDADLVGMSRALVADAALPARTRAGEGDRARPCIACNVCWGAVAAGKPLYCIYNPSVGEEGRLDADRPPRATTSKRVVVIGGGLAGLEAARVAALRGHDVVLFEQSARLGGQALLAARLPGRGEFGLMTDWLVHRVRELPIDVRLSTEATADAVLALSPEVVIVATGSLPPEPTLAGESRSLEAAILAGAERLTRQLAGLTGVEAHGFPTRVTTTWDVITVLARSAEDPARGTALPRQEVAQRAARAGVTIGTRVAVVDREGEHEACGTAELLADAGKRVWLVTRHDLAGQLMNYVSRIGATRRLLAREVTILTGVEAVTFKNGALGLRNLYSGQEHAVEGIDTVVLAGPNRAVDRLAVELRGQVSELHAIGDCQAPRRAAAAVHEAHRVARTI